MKKILGMWIALLVLGSNATTASAKCILPLTTEKLVHKITEGKGRFVYVHQSMKTEKGTARVDHFKDLLKFDVIYTALRGMEVKEFTLKYTADEFRNRGGRIVVFKDTAKGSKYLNNTLYLVSFYASDYEFGQIYISDNSGLGSFRTVAEIDDGGIVNCTLLSDQSAD